MSGEIQVRFPTQYSHSVKIEQTAKGARVSVHVFSNSQEEAISQALHMYGEAKRRLEERGHQVAPIESKEEPSRTEPVYSETA